MRIGLVGAPNSGKTALAKALHDTYYGDRSIAIVDDYVPALREETGWAFGHYGGYLANLMVASERLRLGLIQQERSVKDVITCGTLVDTITYTAMNMQVLSHGTAAGQNDAVRLSNAMHTFGMVFHDTFPGSYERILFLRTSSEDPLDQALDTQLEQALDTFGVPYQDVGSTDQIGASLIALYAADEEQDEAQAA